jgi:hypothetical protein
MTERHIETMSVLWDGEAVDPDALAAALADPAARAALVDFARLGAGVRRETAPLPASLAALRRDQRWLNRRVPVGAVAALLVLIFLAGWLLPRPLHPRLAEPPQPTRIISFEPGVDWQSMP